MTSPQGNKVANQFVLEERGEGWNGNFGMRRTFQSYDSIIAVITYWNDGSPKVELDQEFWNYSRTTSKYRCMFLGETTKETEAKIKSGEYKLTHLNS